MAQVPDAAQSEQQPIQPRTVSEILDEMNAEDKAKWDKRVKQAETGVKQAVGQFADTARSVGRAAGLKGAGLDSFMGRSLDDMGRMAVMVGVSRFLCSDGAEQQAEAQSEGEAKAMYVPDDRVLQGMREQETNLRMQGVTPKKLLYTDAQAKRMGIGDIGRAKDLGLLAEPEGSAVKAYEADLAGSAARAGLPGNVRVVKKIKKLPVYEQDEGPVYSGPDDGLAKIDLVDGSKDVSKLYAQATDDMAEVTARAQRERAEQQAQQNPAKAPEAQGPDKTASRVADMNDAFGSRLDAEIRKQREAGLAELDF